EKLRALVEGQLARARALEDFHREVRDDPDRAEAADRALILHDGLPARLFLRYHAEARTSFHRAYGSLVKALELDTAANSPNEAGAGAGAEHEPPVEAVSRTEADAGANPEDSEPSGSPPRPARKSRSSEEPVGVLLL